MAFKNKRKKAYLRPTEAKVAKRHTSLCVDLAPGFTNTDVSSADVICRLAVAARIRLMIVCKVNCRRGGDVIS